VATSGVLDYAVDDFAIALTRRLGDEADHATDTLPAKIFATAPEALDGAKTATAVVLPQGSDRGVMHIFDVATTR
jgi:hypothetical protein